MRTVRATRAACSTAAADPAALPASLEAPEAFVGDHVCVTPDTSYQAHVDNGKADERRMRSVARITKSLLKGGRDRKG